MTEATAKVRSQRGLDRIVVFAGAGDPLTRLAALLNRRATTSSAARQE